MLGYLIYDQKDIDRSSNRNFINWLIEEASSYGLTLKLYTQNDLPKEPPDFTINRSRFYELSDKFDCMHFNSPEVTKIANDKWLTYQTFKDLVPMMKTTLASKANEFPMVIKSRFGHGGEGVHLVESQNDFNDDYIAQEVATKGKDLRVYILDNKVYTAIMRSNDTDFKSNYSLGGKASLHTLSEEELKLIEIILNRLPIAYGGIDFLYHQGQPVLNEIEDPVGAKMVYNLTDKNIVKDYIKMIAKKIGR